MAGVAGVAGGGGGGGGVAQTNRRAGPQMCGAPVGRLGNEMPISL